jgi:hypothetical protein
MIQSKVRDSQAEDSTPEAVEELDFGRQVLSIALLAFMLIRGSLP